MLKTDDDTVLLVFERIHGEMSGACYAETITNEDGDTVAVACMKNGHECWRATLAELAFDFMALRHFGDDHAE